MHGSPWLPSPTSQRLVWKFPSHNILLKVKTMKFPYRNKLTNSKISKLTVKDYSTNDDAIKPNGFWYGIRNKWYKYACPLFLLNSLEFNEKRGYPQFSFL